MRWTCGGRWNRFVGGGLRRLQRRGSGTVAMLDTIGGRLMPAARESLLALELQARELFESAQVADLSKLVRDRPVSTLGLAAVAGALLGRLSLGRGAR